MIGEATGMEGAGQAKASWLPATAVTLIMVLVAMDLFMVPIATTALVQEFDTSAGIVQTAIALFSLVLASLCILGGKLGDIYGKKRIFLTGLVLYGISALITALAPNIFVMIASFSVLRAVAVALAVPASVALIIANYDDPAQRGKAFALYGFGIMLSGLLAPLMMGFMADKLTWRIPFGLEVLVVLVALALSRHMRETATVKAPIDYLGTVLAFLGIGAVVLGGILGPAGVVENQRQVDDVGILEVAEEFLEKELLGILRCRERVEAVDAATFCVAAG